MSILSRFRDLMASNINALLEKATDPEKEVDDYIRSLTRDLGQLQAEASAMAMEERRSRREWEDAADEIRKLQRYAERALENGQDAEARRFLERKAALQAKEHQLKATYAAAADKAAQMKELQAKLALDLERLEARRRNLQERMLAAKSQMRQNQLGSSGEVEAAFRALEEKADQQYREAMALAELRRSPRDELDELLAQLEQPVTKKTSTVEEELEVLRAEQRAKE